MYITPDMFVALDDPSTIDVFACAIFTARMMSNSEPRLLDLLDIMSNPHWDDSIERSPSCGPAV